MSSVYMASTHDSTDLSLNHLSNEFQQLHFTLKSHLAVLKPQLQASDSENVSCMY